MIPRKLLTITFLILFIASCKKEDALINVDNISGLGGDTWVKGAIDKYIYDSMTVPYNSSVKYKYDQFELDLNKTLVPVKEEKVIPVLSTIKKAWIDPYVAEAGLPFFKKFGSKFIVMVGSGAFDPSNGTTVLGQASDAGNKILLYQLNYFNTRSTVGYKPSDSVLIKQLFHVIEHEFAHVLSYNILYPFSFNQVGSRFYTSDWTNISNQEALNEGFISSYAMSGVIDDFAETVSLMIIEGKGGFDNMVNSINYTGITPNGSTAADAKSRLRQKEAIIVTYFKQSYNIDFYNLQARTRAALVSLIY